MPTKRTTKSYRARESIQATPLLILFLLFWKVDFEVYIGNKWHPLPLTSDGGKSPHSHLTESLHLFSCFFLKQFLQIKGAMILAHSHLLEDPWPNSEVCIYSLFEYLGVGRGNFHLTFQNIPFLRVTFLVWTLWCGCIWLKLFLFLAHLAVNPNLISVHVCVCWVVWQVELLLRFNHGHHIRSQISVLWKVKMEIVSDS